MIKTKIQRTAREWIASVLVSGELVAEAHCADFSEALRFCCQERVRLQVAR